MAELGQHISMEDQINMCDNGIGESQKNEYHGSQVLDSFNSLALSQKIETRDRNNTMFPMFNQAEMDDEPLAQSAHNTTYLSAMP
jgi:hypothetical protein